MDLGSHWKDFHEIWYWRIFRKSVQIFQVSLAAGKNILHEDLCTFMIISRSVVLKMKCVSKPVQKFTTQFYVKYFSPKTVPLRNNVEKSGRARQDTDGNITRRMRVAWRTIKATDTQRNKYCFSKATIFKRTALSVTSHAHCISCNLLVLFLARVLYSELFCVAKFS